VRALQLRSQLLQNAHFVVDMVADIDLYDRIVGVGGIILLRRVLESADVAFRIILGTEVIVSQLGAGQNDL
jgi:hypothetical protein